MYVSVSAGGGGTAAPYSNAKHLGVVDSDHTALGYIVVSPT